MSLSSAACDYSDDWFIPFVGDDVVAKCTSNFKKQSCIRYSKGASLDLKCVRMRLAAGLRLDPLGELIALPQTL